MNVLFRVLTSCFMVPSPSYLQNRFSKIFLVDISIHSVIDPSFWAPI